MNEYRFAPLTRAEKQTLRDFISERYPNHNQILLAGFASVFWQNMKSGMKKKEAANLAHAEGLKSFINWTNPADVEEAQATLRIVKLDLMQNGPYSKGICKSQFEGTESLFIACWRRLTHLRKRGFVVKTQIEAEEALYKIAKFKTSNPKSVFYLDNCYRIPPEQLTADQFVEKAALTHIKTPRGIFRIITEQPPKASHLSLWFVHGEWCIVGDGTYAFAASKDTWNKLKGDDKSHE